MKPLFPARTFDGELWIRASDVTVFARDVARYRWLRECCDRNDQICPCCGYDGLDLFDGVKLDSNIDAAMTAGSAE